MCWARPRKTPCGAGLPQPARSATALSTARCLGWLAISLRRNSSGSCADRMGELVDEAFEIDGVLVDVHAAPEARRDVRIAHGVVDQQVRDVVAERALRAAGVEALEHDRVLAVLQVLRMSEGEDRLAGDAHVQPGQVAVGIERAGHLALRDRMVAAVRHVLFARPDQLDRRAGHLLGDRDRLLHVVVGGAPAESAAEQHLVHVAFGDRQAGGLRERAPARPRRSASGTHTSHLSRV